MGRAANSGLRDAAHVIEGLAALAPGGARPAVRLEEFRAVATITGYAVQAVARLQARARRR
jgi:hypothetical protein